MELRLPTPCLVVLVGPSASGKSTWAEQTFHGSEIVSSDRLRGMVGAGEDDQQASEAAFSLLEQIVTERMTRKLTTVIDTLGYHQESRQRWVALAHDAGLPAFAIVFDTPATEARLRNTERERPIPQAVLSRQYGRFSSVQTELEQDGFDQVHTEQPLALVTSTIAGVEPAGTAPEVEATTTHSFGLMISRFDWGNDRGALRRRLASIAQRAESAGFRDLWVMDHFRQIPQVGRAWEDMPEAYTTLAYLAGMTDRIRLGALVTDVTQRHPVVLGKMVATLDVMSAGRANVGLGIGSNRKEHEGYGMAFPPTRERYDMLEDTLEMLPLLWGKGTPSFSGRTFSAPELVCYPRPIQDHVPVLVGGSGEKRTLRLVAQHADACNLFGRPDAVKMKVDVLHAHCADVDRDPAEIEVTHLINAMTGPDRVSLRKRVDELRGRSTTADEFAARHNAGTVDDQVAHFAAYRDAGARHSIVVLPDAHLDDSIETFGEVIQTIARP